MDQHCPGGYGEGGGEDKRMKCLKICLAGSLGLALLFYYIQVQLILVKD